MKHVFIINPRAGKGKALELIRPQIEAYINEHNLDAEIHVPDSPHAAQDFIRAEASKGQPVRFYACGGDGTLSETANGMIKGGHKTKIGYIPSGTTNDFAYGIGLSSDIMTAADDIVSGAPKAFDAG